MTALLDHIRTLIEKTGPISLARYMDLALQHPEHGYYQSGDPLGRSGDFITAPEVSQMFGELIGLCCAEAWKAMGKPEQFVLLELGPGRGTLMSDALRATAKIHGFHTAMNLRLLESNKTLRKMQMEKLAAYNPTFLDEVEELHAPISSSRRKSGSSASGSEHKMPLVSPYEPEADIYRRGRGELDSGVRRNDDAEKLPTLIIANEFFDALPVRQFEKSADGWRERLVTVDGDELTFILSAPDPAFLLFIPQDIRDAVIGTVHEVSLPALTIMRQLAKHVVQFGGALLLIDYGYAAPPGKGTVQAVSSHRHADILERPGEVDLTAHVDFMALRQMAQVQGAKTLGPVTQGEYLQSLGIDMRAKQLKHNVTPEQSTAIDTALQRLIDPGEMGTLFKAMAVVAPTTGSLAGF